ncbi:hypothetical protein DRN77_02875 [Methanosarcinales archaeon]|nr:MAG: hypothetical protein DRN77_02875 [Methanosarcinales archaeon]
MITPEQFKEDVRAWAEEVGVEPKEIHLRRMKRKIGSCSSKGRLTFDRSLLEESDEMRSEAIIHELLHLKYPNHGTMFRILVDAYLRKGTVKRSGKERNSADEIV